MKAITIWQPYATLLAIKEKRLETRGRRTHYRGAIAIHAAKYIDRVACEKPEIKAALARHGCTVDNLPTGSIVAIANLTECWEVVGEEEGVQSCLLDSQKNRTMSIAQDSNEFLFGDFSVGRFALEMSDVNRLASPISVKGQQGIWNWDGGKL
jgi:hypothetical protein